MLDKNQIENMKEQVISHINKNFPEDKKQEAIEQILSMDDDEFIHLLKENKIIDENENEIQKTNSNSGKCIFCSIIFGDIPSVKIDENEKAIAVLEINPISEGHTLVVPKNHISSKETIDKKTEELILNIKKKLEDSLKPKEIKIFVSEITNHMLINLVPIYANETIDSERKHATNEELIEIKKKIEDFSNPRKGAGESLHEGNPQTSVGSRSGGLVGGIDEPPQEKKEEKPKKEIYSGLIPKRIP